LGSGETGSFHSVADLTHVKIKMFAKRPEQLGQEEVYVGGTPSEAYDPGGTL